MKRFLGFTVLGILISTPIFADQNPLTPQTENGVSFISGGVGGEERDALHAMRAEYNLSLMFSVKGSGEYLSDIKVRIQDASGAVSVETVADGPLLYAKLKPGKYNVSVDQNGHEINKKVTVGANKMVALSFVWPE